MRRVLLCLLFVIGCDFGDLGETKRIPPAADAGADVQAAPPPQSAVKEAIAGAALDLSYCPVNEAIRDCQTGGASGTEAGWDWDRPGPNELQIAGYGPQGWRCKIIYCDIPQYNNSFNAGAIGELSRFGLGYGIRYMRNGLGTYSRSYPERCWSGGIAHESNGMQQMIWWTERFKSLDCWPNRANVNPYQWY